MAQLSVTAIRPKKFTVFNPTALQSEGRKQMRLYLQAVRDELIANYEEAEQTPRGARLEGRATAKTKRTRQWVRGIGDKRDRSQNLRASWHIEVSGSTGSEGILFNTATYAVYVQGPRREHGRGPGTRQAAHMRRRGWRSITDVARETKPLFFTLMNRVYGPRAFGEE